MSSESNGGAERYRNFSEMPDDVLRSFANALAEAGRKKPRKRDAMIAAREVKHV